MRGCFRVTRSSLSMERERLTRERSRRPDTQPVAYRAPRSSAQDRPADRGPERITTRMAEERLMNEATPVELSEDRVPLEEIGEAVEELVDLYGGEITARRENDVS